MPKRPTFLGLSTVALKTAAQPLAVAKSGACGAGKHWTGEWKDPDKRAARRPAS